VIDLEVIMSHGTVSVIITLIKVLAFGNPSAGAAPGGVSEVSRNQSGQIDIL